MALKLSAAMRAMVLDGGVQALAGETFTLDPSAEYTNAESVTFEVDSVDVDGFTVRLDAPMRLVRLPSTEVRCPKCGKKLGESLQGTYTTTCPRCKERVTITR